MTLRLPIIAVLVSCFAADVFAFNASGHKIIAEIAWQKLGADERSAIVAVLRKHPRFSQDFEDEMPANIANQESAVQDHWIFCQAAIWPDIARGIPQPERNQFHRPRWHYINLPVFLDGGQATSMGGNISVNTDFSLPSGGDEALLNGIQAVKNSLSIVTSPSSTDAEKAVHYCWLLHVIADLAQPLHAASLFTEELFPNGDKGGNDLKVRREGASGDGQKLHSVWDGLLGKSGNFNDILSKASQIIEAHQAEFTTAFVALPNDIWATESQALALQFAYGPILAELRTAEEQGDLNVIDVPASYFADSGAVVRRQAASAGVRLAGVLTSTVPTSGGAMPVLIGARGLSIPAVIAGRKTVATQRLNQSHVARGRSAGAESEDLVIELEALRDEVRHLRNLLKGNNRSESRRSRTLPTRHMHAHDDGEQCDCDADE